MSRRLNLSEKDPGVLAFCAKIAAEEGFTENNLGAFIKSLLITHPKIQERLRQELDKWPTLLPKP